MFLARIDDSQCDRIHFSLTADHWFDKGYMGKHQVALKEYCVEFLLKEELQESTDRCTGHHDIHVTDILLETMFNTIRSNR